MPILCYLRLTIGYLNHSWGVGPNTFKRWERQQADATAKAVEAAQRWRRKAGLHKDQDGVFRLPKASN